MINKYSQRTPSPFSRDTSYDDGNSSEPSWYEEYQKNLQKYSVQSQQSIYEQISSILGNSKSKYSSVEEAVDDLKERTGLKAFLESKTSTASFNGTEPEIFKTIPEMKVFIDNFIDDRPGTSVEAVVHDLMRMETVKSRLPDKTDVGNEVRSYINEKLGQSKKDNSDMNEVNMNIGRVENNVDVDENRPFEFCEPQGH